MQNFSFLARLEVAEKFVVGWGDVAQAIWWSGPSLGFSFSQAEQYIWLLQSIYYIWIVDDNDTSVRLAPLLLSFLSF